MLAREGGDEGLSVDERVLRARRQYGDEVPEGVLHEEGMRVWERLYGKIPPRSDGSVGPEAVVKGAPGTGMLRLADDGALEEVEFEEEGEGDGVRDKRRKRRLMEGKMRRNWDDEILAGDIERAMRGQATEQDNVLGDEVDEDDDLARRTHPLTAFNRFGTSPSTLHLPRDSFVDPATVLLSGIPTVHLSEAANRLFGGGGLPYSTSTPASAKTKQARPIALSAAQDGMSEIEGDVYLSTLMPGIYASVASALTETRKRLGTKWAEGLVKKAQKGELRILDAGGAGAGAMAVREMLRAEWERMQEDEISSTAVATVDGKIGGANAAPPLGHATVLTGSDVLRKRASQLLENTAFIPRLPDYVHTETAQMEGKFDLVIAPHTLWPLGETWVQRTHALNLWSLLRNEGGVLVLLEKGVPRGFELIAAARELLLEKRIGTPESRANDIDAGPEIVWEGEEAEAEPVKSKKRVEVEAKKQEKGMIIAPCTNHTGCPMYVQRGVVKGRKDICHFEQRYVRPGFLQKVLGARDKNFEDVKFSYLAVMRGRDMREVEAGAEAAVVDGTGPQGLVQGSEAADAAFEGYLGEAEDDAFAEGETAPHSLSLPRAVLPPLKRRGHVTLDLCTPAGTLERWTVPRSYSRQAFRDARKSKWGDLWALGAKTRVLRNLRTDKHARRDEEARSGKKDVGRGDLLGVDEEGRIVVGGSMGSEGVKVKERRKMKVKGIRDKRDKKGTGNGRRKYQTEE